MAYFHPILPNAINTRGRICGNFFEGQATKQAVTSPKEEGKGYLEYSLCLGRKQRQERYWAVVNESLWKGKEGLGNGRCQRK